MFAKVYPREKYLSKIRPFFDSDIIKVITGIDKFRDQQEGVHHINAIDLFLGKEKIGD